MNVFPWRPGSRPINLVYFSEKRQKVSTLFYYQLFSFACLSTDSFSLKPCMLIIMLTDMQGVYAIASWHTKIIEPKKKTGVNERNWRDICIFNVSTETIVHLALWELNFSNVHLYFGVIPPLDFFMFNPLTPKSDQHVISPYNIASESKKITRIKEMSPTKELHDC